MDYESSYESTDIQQYPCPRCRRPMRSCPRCGYRYCPRCGYGSAPDYRPGYRYSPGFGPGFGPGYNYRLDSR